MLMNGQVLSYEEMALIHKESIKILEEVGVKVPSERALSILEKAGAQVNYDTKIVFITENMVNKALKKSPKEFTLGARNPEFNLKVPTGRSTINMDGAGSYTIDFQTGQRRRAVLNDIKNACKIFEQIPTATVFWSPITPADVAPEAQGVVSSATSMIYSSKHLQDEVQRADEVPYIIELCKVILGSEQEVIERKIYSACYCTVSPLCHDKEMLEATMDLVKYQAPVLVYPMPACGTTAAASLYSNIALGNAEALSSFVIFQLTSPGTPLIYGSASGIVDRKSGMFLGGAVETSLINTAMCMMGKYYGFPTIIAGCISDANGIGIQSASEKIFSMLPLVLNDADVIQGIGQIECSMTLSLEQMLIDEELFEMCLRLRDGIDICPEKSYFEDIHHVGQGGHFLKSKSTRKAFRSKEFYLPKLKSFTTYDSWVKLDSPSLADTAHKKVEQILEAEQINQLDPVKEKIIKEIIEEATAKL